MCLQLQGKIVGCFLRALQLVAPPDADLQLQYVEGVLVFDILAEPPLPAQQVFHHAEEQAESESFIAEVAGRVAAATLLIVFAGGQAGPAGVTASAVPGH